MNAIELSQIYKHFRFYDKPVNRLKEIGMLFSINGPDFKWRHPGNINLNFHGVEAHTLLNSLQPNLCASTGAACASGTIESSHVLRAIGVTDENSACSIRFSIGRFTNEDQLEQSVNLIREKIESLT